MEPQDTLAALEIHREWHYVNWPLDRSLGANTEKSASRSDPVKSSYPTERGELRQQLERLPERLRDLRLADSERSVALAWLIHLVGDAHTPLHTATWRDDAGDWSLGGNRFPVFDPLDARRPETNLHRFWDDLPGASWLRGKPLQQRAAELQARFPAAMIEQADPPRWLEESHQWVALAVLPPDVQFFTVDSAYRTQAAEVADRRIVEAGVRLGRWLEMLLAREAHR